MFVLAAGRMCCPARAGGEAAAAGAGGVPRAAGGGAGPPGAGEVHGARRRGVRLGARQPRALGGTPRQPHAAAEGRLGGGAARPTCAGKAAAAGVALRVAPLQAQLWNAWNPAPSRASMQLLACYTGSVPSVQCTRCDACGHDAGCSAVAGGGCSFWRDGLSRRDRSQPRRRSHCISGTACRGAVCGIWNQRPTTRRPQSRSMSAWRCPRQPWQRSGSRRLLQCLQGQTGPDMGSAEADAARAAARTEMLRRAEEAAAVGRACLSAPSEEPILCCFGTWSEQLTQMR